MPYVSIVGDSISTYEGFNPDGYAVYYNREMQERNGLHSVEDTWWAKVCQALGENLLVNNSYSGSKVTGGVFPAGSCLERAAGLHTAEHTPDLILIYMGFNDFGYGVRMSENGNAPTSFDNAYEKMLEMIQHRYPCASVVCGTLMRTKIRNRDSWNLPEVRLGVRFEDYNNVIRKISGKHSCRIADLAATGDRYETLDGTHPTVQGHAQLAKTWIQELSGLGLIPAQETENTRRSDGCNVVKLLRNLLKKNNRIKHTNGCLK